MTTTQLGLVIIYDNMLYSSGGILSYLGLLGGGFCPGGDFVRGDYVRVGFCPVTLFSNRVRVGRSRSSKVVYFGTNRKDVCICVLVINSNFGLILHRFGDTATYWLKTANFSYPTHLTPSLGVNPFEFLDEFFYPEN